MPQKSCVFCGAPVAPKPFLAALFGQQLVKIPKMNPKVCLCVCVLAHNYKSLYFTTTQPPPLTDSDGFCADCAS